MVVVLWDYGGCKNRSGSEEGMKLISGMMKESIVAVVHYSGDKKRRCMEDRKGSMCV